MYKKWFSKLMIVVVALSMVLSACGGGTTEPSKESEKPAVESKVEESKEPAEDKAEETEHVTLKWYVRQAEPEGRERVLEAANEIVEQELNATLDLEFINPGDYNEKMQIIMAAGEEFDICWTSEWANKYDSNAAKGAYLALDDYFNDEYMPDILAAIPENLWEGVKVNGKIYGIPNLQVMYDQAGLWFRKDMADKYDLDVEGITSWEDLTPIFQAIKDNEPNDVFAYRGTIPGTKIETAFDQNATVISSRLFIYDADTKTVHNDFYENYLDTLKLFRTWYEAGFVPNDAATLQDEVSMYRAGKMFSRYHRIKPGNEAEFYNNHGFEIYGVPIGKKIITTSGIQSTLNSVSVTSKNPERAVEFINLLYKDAQLYNILVFGLEGQDYEMIDDLHLRPIEGGYTGTSWMMGNQFNALLLEGQPDDVWEQTIQGNSEASYDPLVGFILDRSPIETELSSCEAVFKEYEPILLYGLDDPEKALGEMNVKLEAAGIEEATAEIQRQVDEFLASK